MAPRRRRRVLVVDDDDDVCGVIADVLRARGHAVHAAGCGAEALVRVATVATDLILLDLVLPDMSGVELLERRRHAPWAEVPVVILSGSEDARMIARRRQLRVLRKPFGVDELIAIVEDEIWWPPEPSR
jgi:CheY-like chemotaxis protein